MEFPFWSKDIETMDRSQLEQLQLQRLRDIVGYALKTPLYQKRLAKAWIHSPDDIKTLSDLRKIPFTVKDDLRQSYPKGLLAVDMEQVVRVHSSSGTTGVPTVIYYTRDDLNRWTDLLARGIVASGATSKDIFQNMMSYGLFTGGLGLHYGAERVGLTVIPVGGGNTQRQIQIMRDFRTTVLHITPSYLLHIHQRLPEFHLTPADLNLKKAWMGSEPHSENTRLKLQNLFGIDIYNSYGLSEMNGPGVAFECVYKNDMHVWEDGYLIEIINPQTGEPAEEGQEGEVVFTNLIRHAMPLLRYRTRDLAFLHPEPCPCGRTSRRMSRITGRTDDMLIINGVNVFPSQIEAILLAIEGVEPQYQLIVDRAGNLDTLEIQVEVGEQIFANADEVRVLQNMERRIVKDIKDYLGVTAKVKLVEPKTIQRLEGKSSRVLDKRRI